MSVDTPPRWVHIADVVIKAIALVCAVLGAVFVYFAHDQKYNSLQQQLAKVQTQVLKSEKARNEAQTHESNNAQAARVVCTPRIEQVYLNDSLQQIRVPLTLSNIGNQSASIGAAEVKVYRGTLSPEPAELVEKARELLTLERENPWRAGLTEELRKNLLAQYDALHVKCPHGKLFFLDGGGGDVIWQEEATLRKEGDYELTPGQENEVEFGLMSTHFYGHPLWIRFVPTVMVDETKCHFGEQVVAVLPSILPEFGSGVPVQQTSASPDRRSSYTTLKRVPVAPTTSSETIRP